MVRPHTVRQHPRRTAGGVTVVGAHNRALGQVSSDFRHRLRALLDSGYNHGATRPIDWSVSGTRSLDVLKKKIESRMGMANKGIRVASLRAEGERALSAAYRLILDEQERLARADWQTEEMTQGSRIVRVGNGRTRRFWDARKADDWAAEQLRGLPPGTRAEIFHDTGAYSKQPYSALEVNAHGHVVRAAVAPLPPFQPAP